MSTISSPIEDSDSEVSFSDSTSTISLPNGDLQKYVIRFTPQEKYTVETAEEWLYNHFPKYVIALETQPQEHYHIVIETEKDLEELKESIREFLFQFWPKRERGWGNAQYNVQVAKENPEGWRDMAVSYAVKDRSQVSYDGYSDEYIQECIDQSFKKKSPANFKLDYQALCSRFLEEEMDAREFMAHFMMLKSKYGQTVNAQQAYSYYNSNLLTKVGESAAYQLAEEFLYKV